jgi:hypothetical protein
MRAATVYVWISLGAVLSVGCHRGSNTPQQAQAPPLQTGKGTLSAAATTAPPGKSDSPLASPLPQPSSQAVPLPPPTPKKVRKKVKPAPKPVDTAQAASPAPAPERVTPPGPASGSPIGQLTTGDSATEEKSKRETADLINATQQGLSGIKRNLSNEEKVTSTQIHTFLKQAQQALDNGDTEGAHGLAMKAKQLLDELTTP